MKKLLCLISVLAVAMSAYINVSAADGVTAKVEINGNIMKIYGKTTSSGEKDVLLRVDRYSDTSVSIDNIDTECIYIEQKTTAPDGSFEFYCILKEADQSSVTSIDDFVPEKYVYSIGAAGDSTDVDSSVIEYYGKSYQELVCRLINEAKAQYASDKEAAVGNIKDILSKTYDTLYVDAKIYEQYMTAPSNYDTLVGYFARLPKIMEMPELKGQLNEAASVTALKDNKNDAEKLMELLDDEGYRESIGINSSSAVQSYNDFKNLCGAEMAKAFANSDFGSLAESKEKFEFAVISTALKECVTAYQVNMLLKANEELLHIDMAQYQLIDAECVVLSGKTITSLSDIKTAIVDIIGKRSQGSGSGGGGGSSSGGRSGGGSGSSGGSGGSGSKNFGILNSVPIPQQTAPVEETPLFKDMSGFDWAKESVEFLYKAGVINGRGDGCFAPQDNVTREEFLKMILSALAIPVTQTANKEFSDVSQEAWYAGYINVGYEKGIIKGVDDNMFGVGIPIKREDVTVIIYNALNSLNLIDEEASFTNDFTDGALISDYAQEAVSYMKQKNIISGYPDGSFKPAGSLTRAESAVAVKNVSEYVSRFYKGGIN